MAYTCIPLADWLEQKIFHSDITIREFVRIVANQDGGAHSDPNYKSLLNRISGAMIMYKIGSNFGQNEFLYYRAQIVEIGEYVLGICEGLLKEKI